MSEQGEAVQPRFADRARLLTVASLFAAMVAGPSLSVGFVGDDYMHGSYILDHLTSRATRGPWWNMFDTRVPVAEQISNGGLPWWSSPHLHVGLFRPLATLSQYIDYVLWPTQPVMMHLHNIVIYVLLVVVACDLYSRVLLRPVVIWAASLLYAVDDAHALTTAWIASRNTLLTALFSLLCLAWYQRQRVHNSRLASWLAPLALLFAHASSEGAVAIWAYLLAYAAFLDHGSPRQRLRALLPLALVSVSWVGLAAALGFGVQGSGAYLDPRADPWRFLAELPHRLPPLLLAQFGITVELGTQLSSGVLLAIHSLVVLLMVVAAALVVRTWSREPVVRFLVVGCLASLLPLCAVGPIGRLLLISGWGAQGLLAQLFVGVLWPSLQGHARLAGRALCVVMLTLSSLIAVDGAYSAPVWWMRLHSHFRAAALTLPRGKERVAAAIMLVNTRDYLATPFILLYRRLFAEPGPLFMHVLGVSTEAVSVFRPDAASLVLTPAHGYLNDATSILVRPRNEPFSLHERINLFGSFISVEALTADKRPAQVRVQTFGLEDPRLLWVVWDDRTQRFRRFVLPAVGQTVVLPAAVSVER